MLRKILSVAFVTIFILALVLLVTAFLGGIPIGYDNHHIIIYGSYTCCDVRPTSRDTVMYSRVRNKKDCLKLGGRVLSSTWVSVYRMRS
jgi:hypothetical protein